MRALAFFNPWPCCSMPTSAVSKKSVDLHEQNNELAAKSNQCGNVNLVSVWLPPQVSFSCQSSIQSAVSNPIILFQLTALGYLKQQGEGSEMARVLFFNIYLRFTLRWCTVHSECFSQYRLTSEPFTLLSPWLPQWSQSSSLSLTSLRSVSTESQTSQPLFSKFWFCPRVVLASLSVPLHHWGVANCFVLL